MVSTTTIADCLRGCEIGTLQTVGLMQVIPLLSDLEDSRFVAPALARVRTTSYGVLEVRNPGGGTLLLPSAVTYVVKAKVQDHALPHAALVGEQARRRFDTAACVQSTQPGLIPEDAHALSILPFALREKAHEKRGVRDFQKLWRGISQLRQQAGEAHADGDLSRFLDRFEQEMDLFVAEFERVPRQVGAVVLVAGHVLGVERGPSAQWFSDVWAALIRECYGSAAVLARRAGAAVPQTTPLRGARDLDDLAAAVEQAAAADAEETRAKVRTLAADPFDRSVEDRIGAFAREAIANPQFVGELVSEGERVHYLSVVRRASWQTSEPWRNARPFAA